MIECCIARQCEFSFKTSSLQSTTVISISFSLQHEALITPANETSSKVQKEFQMLKLNIMTCRINKAVNKYPQLPTEISQWAQSSLI